MISEGSSGLRDVIELFRRSKFSVIVRGKKAETLSVCKDIIHLPRQTMGLNVSQASASGNLTGLSQDRPRH